MEGVTDLVVNQCKVSFLLRGNLDAIMKKIAATTITNIAVEEPDLEEIFMHFYEKEGV